MSALLTDILQFCADHDMAETRFGDLALNDKPFVSQLRGDGDKAPRRVWPETEQKVRDFMAVYRSRSEAA